MEEEEPHHIPVNGTLDLHFFKPEDLSTLVDEYIHACLEREIYTVRFIHGKGIGNIRRSVHSLLERNPHVISYSLADPSRGSWGATMATLSAEPRSTKKPRSR
ncbi:MAG: Smr/MutS family protein [Balneolaceae bacterium]|nr:Smr/MutS family protein [Balneolaceae bacterium]MCH8547958.1 Smr/MutS family protein [Balneolaceae bacterium]